MGTSTNANMELLTQNPLRALLDRADREYPMPVIVGHSLMSHIAFREWRGPSEAPHQFSWTHSLLASYLCTGNAGGWVSQMMLKPGEPEGSVRHPHVALAWVGAYLAVYWSPEDFMFKILSQKRNPLRLACMTMDTVDAYTTAVWFICVPLGLGFPAPGGARTQQGLQGVVGTALGRCIPGSVLSLGVPAARTCLQGGSSCQPCAIRARGDWPSLRCSPRILSGCEPRAPTASSRTEGLDGNCYQIPARPTKALNNTNESG